MDKQYKIYLAGHDGLVGSALLSQLKTHGYHNIITRSLIELDLTNQSATANFFLAEKPDIVVLAAALVGGIESNRTRPAEFCYQNLMIQTNVIHQSYVHGVKKLLFLGSSCIYPRECPQPMKEEYLLSGKLEPTNEAYALAKIAGLKMCTYYNQQYGTDFISVMPSNLYGPGDNYHPEHSHVLPALIRKFHQAEIRHEPAVTVWGSGNARRELTYSEDMTAACLFLLETYKSSDFINIGTGSDISIRDLAELVREVIGYNGNIIFDPTKPDGMPQKLLDVSKLNALGWQSKTSLVQGITLCYRDYLTRYGGDL